MIVARENFFNSFDALPIACWLASFDLRCVRVIPSLLSFLSCALVFSGTRQKSFDIKIDTALLRSRL